MARLSQYGLACFLEGSRRLRHLVWHSDSRVAGTSTSLQSWLALEGAIAVKAIPDPLTILASRGAARRCKQKRFPGHRRRHRQVATDKTLQTLQTDSTDILVDDESQYTWTDGSDLHLPVSDPSAGDHHTLGFGDLAVGLCLVLVAWRMFRTSPVPTRPRSRPPVLCAGIVMQLAGRMWYCLLNLLQWCVQTTFRESVEVPYVQVHGNAHTDQSTFEQKTFGNYQYSHLSENGMPGDETESVLGYWDHLIHNQVESTYVQIHEDGALLADLEEPQLYRDIKWWRQQFLASHAMEAASQIFSTTLWARARRCLNKLAHITNGNGGPVRSCSPTEPYQDTQSDLDDMIAWCADAPDQSIDDMHWRDVLHRVPQWDPLPVTWIPPPPPHQLAQDWPVQIQCNVLGENLMITTTQSTTVRQLLEFAAIRACVNADELVVLDAGDIIARSTSVADLQALHVEFQLHGGAGDQAGQPPNSTARSSRGRSRTPARTRPVNLTKPWSDQTPTTQSPWTARSGTCSSSAQCQKVERCITSTCHSMTWFEIFAGTLAGLPKEALRLLNFGKA